MSYPDASDRTFEHNPALGSNRPRLSLTLDVAPDESRFPRLARERGTGSGTSWDVASDVEQESTPHRRKHVHRDTVVRTRPRRISRTGNEAEDHAHIRLRARSGDV